MLLIEDWNAAFVASAKPPELSLPVLKKIDFKISFETTETIDHEPVYGDQSPILPFAASEVFYSTIVSSRRLTAVHKDCKDAYEITFDVKDSNFSFQAGDTIGIIPQNKISEVNDILNHLDLLTKADCIYNLSNANKLNFIPLKSTLRYVLTYCVDIRCIIKKQFLLSLSTFTEDEKEKKALQYLSSKEGKNLYDDLLLAKKMCILDIFSVFKTCKPTAEVLLHHLTRLLPRPYSIVNSGVKDPSVIKICFSVMSIGNKRSGLTTSWLEENILVNTEKDKDTLVNGMSNLNIDQRKSFKVPLYLRKNMSGFVLPKNSDKPMILIGPGTGVAPFIGFLEERMIQSSRSDIWMFTGCRSPLLDFIYEDEIRKFQDQGVLTKLSIAFSRVDGDTKYVQDLIRLNSEEIISFIEKGTYIMVCGDQNEMTKQVELSLADCIVQHLNKSIDEAKTMLAEMKKQKQYVIDAWS